MTDPRDLRISDLKPCPNCRSTELKHCYVYIRCTICLMEGPKSNGGHNDDHADHMDYKWAIESWNNLPRRDEKE